MTENEAIEEFKERLELIEKCYRGEVEDYKQALEIGVKALKKQIPKKPIVEYKNTNDYITEIEWKCPICRTNYIELVPCGEWCNNCGNRIDWSDEE